MVAIQIKKNSKPSFQTKLHLKHSSDRDSASGRQRKQTRRGKAQKFARQQKNPPAQNSRQISNCRAQPRDQCHSSCHPATKRKGVTHTTSMSKLKTYCAAA